MPLIGSVTSANIASPTINGDATVVGNIISNVSAGNPYVRIRTAGAGNNPYIRMEAASNYWDIQSTFSNANDELYFMYNNSSKFEISKDGAVYVADGMPYFGQQTGTFTTNGSGAATLNISGWGWADWASYRRLMIVQFGFYNDANAQLGGWIGTIYQGANGDRISEFYSSASNIFANAGRVTFGSNSGIGQRFFNISSAANSTTYTYVVRSMPLTSYFTSTYGVA